MKQRLFSLDKLKPVPPDQFVYIQGLPNRMVLLNPTKTEMAIIDLFAAEIRRLTPDALVAKTT